MKVTPGGVAVAGFHWLEGVVVAGHVVVVGHVVVARDVIVVASRGGLVRGAAWSREDSEEQGQTRDAVAQQHDYCASSTNSYGVVIGPHSSSSGSTMAKSCW